MTRRKPNSILIKGRNLHEWGVTLDAASKQLKEGRNFVSWGVKLEELANKFYELALETDTYENPCSAEQGKE